MVALFPGLHPDFMSQPWSSLLAWKFVSVRSCPTKTGVGLTLCQPRFYSLHVDSCVVLPVIQDCFSLPNLSSSFSIIIHEVVFVASNIGEMWLAVSAWKDLIVGARILPVAIIHGFDPVASGCIHSLYC